MNYKCLSKVFAGLLGVSLTFNAYQSIEYNSLLNNTHAIRKEYNKKALIYEKRIAESEESNKKNKENFRILEKRVENIEKRFSPNYFPKSNEYNLQRLL
jgi:hypothetical protein